MPTVYAKPKEGEKLKNGSRIHVQSQSSSHNLRQHVHIRLRPVTKWRN